MAIAGIPASKLQAALASSSTPTTCSPTVHLCAPRNLDLATLCAWIRSAGYPLREVPASVFCARVRAAGEDHPLFPLKAMLARSRSNGGREAAAGRAPRPTPPCIGNAAKALRLLEAETADAHRPRATRPQPPQIMEEEHLARALPLLLKETKG